MNTRLQAVRADTKVLIQRTSSLGQENATLSIRSDVLRLFLDRFHLREEERKILSPSSKEINEDFFAAFCRARQIHEDCKVLLRTNQQRAGLSIMEAMALMQEAGYERLYRWTQCMHADPAHASGMPHAQPRHDRACGSALHRLCHPPRPPRALPV
jgi:hypothetical protein